MTPVATFVMIRAGVSASMCAAVSDSVAFLSEGALAFAGLALESRGLSEVQQGGGGRRFFGT